MSQQAEEKIDQSWSQLYEVVEDFDISLFAGAGLSRGNKMPDWAELIARLSSHHSIDTVRQLKNAGFSLPTQLSLAQSTFLGDGAGDEKKTQWTELLRESLYLDFRLQLSEKGLDFELLGPMLRSKALANPQVAEYFRTTNPALHEIVQMCAIRENGLARIISLLTTNHDSLIQYCDRALHGSPRMLRTIERASKSTHADKVPLYHLHGYLLPFPNTEAKREAADRLILTEHEYIARTDQPYHWAATILHWALVESPVVFIGCSMEDELCRRALYRTRAQRIEDANAESASRGKKHSDPKHFSVCMLSDEATNRAIERSYALLDLNPLWVRDYRTTELPDRLSELRKHLAGK